MAASDSLSPPPSDPPSLASLPSPLPSSPPLSPSLKALSLSPISDGSPSSALFLPASLLTFDDPTPTLGDPFELWLTDPDSPPSSPAPVSRPPAPAPADALLSCLAAGAPPPPPPEPDAMLPIYAALGDLIDVDSGSMAFHQEEESQPQQPLPVQTQASLPSPVSVVVGAEEHPAKPEVLPEIGLEKSAKTVGEENGKRKKRADRRKVTKGSSAGLAANGLSGVDTNGMMPRGGKRGAPWSARSVEWDESGRDSGRGQRKRKRGSGAVGSGCSGRNEVGGVKSSVGGKTGVGRRRTEGGKRVGRAGSPDGDERNMPVREKCMRCETTARNTPMMRKGPDGCRSLCNACGLRWSRHGIY